MADEDLIAVVGMAGRFPGAADVDEFWVNALAGTECVSRYGRDELIAAGEPAALVDDPAYVPASAPLADHDCFDAALFGYSPREARLMDPQHRVFLECAWHALEDAGCDPDRFPDRVGVFAGAGMSRYLWTNALAGGAVLDPLEARLLNDKDFLATAASYRLRLRGPSVSVQTACSTSLVAVHLAAQSLLLRESDLALAGGVTVEIPHRVGYLYKEGSVGSPDGHCRPFDHRAQGCVGGSGVGVVALARLADALAQRRPVHAVLRGSAVNNDGALKVGFTAPSVAGQTEAIREALHLAEVDPATVHYVETHGTGTPIGDPIEIEALRAAFGDAAPATVALGSAKATIGHLDAAAGVASLIRAVLAVREGVLPPSPYFEEPNPLLSLDGSPFYLPTAPAPWHGGGPRRAGVSSFGMGGTNAHVIVEQAPLPAEPDPSPRDSELLVLSAASEQALERLRLRLAGAVPGSLADLAHTLAVGRRPLPHRLALVAGSVPQAQAALRDVETRRVRVAGDPPAVAFLFPGQGAQRPGMAAELHRVAPRFRAEVDRCAELLTGHLGFDLRDVLLDPDADPARLNSTDVTQPALFVHCYALAVQWMRWGVAPRVMAGHSIGEYVAACLAGVFSLPDALALVAARGAMMAALPGGSMLAVALPEAEASALRRDGVDLAAVNGPRQCVLSGPAELIGRIQREAVASGIRCLELRTSHAFHSAMLDPMLAPFERELRRVPLRSPSLPFVSGVSGTLIEPAQATDPAYWAGQARATVRFGAGLDQLAEPDTLFLEVGPGKGMAELARRHLRRLRTAPVSSLPGAGEPRDELLAAVGQVWEAGVEIDWSAWYADERRRRVPLPGYPFARERYWVDPPAPNATAPGAVPDVPARPVEPGPAPVGDTGGGGAAGVGGAPARSATEEIVLAVFAEAFGVADIGPEDDFFGLGGTSLLAAEVVHRLRRQLGLHFPVRYLFDAPQVGDLAALLAGESGTEPGDTDGRSDGDGETDSDGDGLDDLAAALSALPADELAELLGPPHEQVRS